MRPYGRALEYASTGGREGRPYDGKRTDKTDGRPLRSPVRFFFKNRLTNLYDCVTVLIA